MALAALPLTADARNRHTDHHPLMRANNADGHHFEERPAQD